MIMALIAPELMVTWAMRQRLSAQQVTRQFDESGYPSVRPAFEERVSVETPGTRNPFLLLFLRFHEGTARLSLLLFTGVLSVLVSPWRFLCALVGWVARRIQSEHSEPDSEVSTWTQTHSFFVLMGGFMLYANGKPYLTLRPDYILKLIHDKCIDAPTLTAKQIHDRSKGNAISKGLVMLQVAWFVMQLITRAVYHLEITQLEVGTLAFAVLNFLTYAVWWDKPLDVQCPHPMYWKSTVSRPEDHIDVSDRDEFAQLRYLPRVFSPIIELIGWPDIATSRKLEVPTFDGSITLKGSDSMVLLLAGYSMGTIFGGIHCMAWFFVFPTYEEQVLWRLSAVVTTCTPCLCLSAYLNSEMIINPFTSVMRGLYLMICFAFAMLYITARVVLLVLMFTTLRNLPPNAYKAVLWTSLVPHL
ncbi:uncharacterized protein HD556DRAFT_1525954 [Suillus plorans]|uniref:Transmembrane protein n=1 Tax=Suillus plorans TaxID=116603 RepID=A0A9P7DKV3_9AGAM|nr:uncharacterized protein HD556DRAFT_1525954 [Suillus plorans]KAG1797341.1 hypothetical protein HD556DRAFT_1525954 [Suillus plorans]